MERAAALRDGDGIGEDLLHPGIRREGLALFDADRGKQAAGFRIEHVERLLLDDFVEVLIEAVVVGMDGVEGLARAADEFQLRRVVLFRERIDAEVLLHVLSGDIKALGDGGAHEDPDVVGSGLDHEIAIRHLALVAGWQDQVLAALALVGTGRTNVLHVAEPGVVESTEHPGRGLENHRAVILEIKVGNDIHGGCVAGQERATWSPSACRRSGPGCIRPHRVS